MERLILKQAIIDSYEHEHAPIPFLYESKEKAITDLKNIFNAHKAILEPYYESVNKLNLELINASRELSEFGSKQKDTAEYKSAEQNFNNAVEKFNQRYSEPSDSFSFGGITLLFSRFRDLTSSNLATFEFYMPEILDLNDFYQHLEK